ncbi:MAG: DUF4167 domain-containing protein [Sphingomonas phyllosphaerae]
MINNRQNGRRRGRGGGQQRQGGGGGHGQRDSGNRIDSRARGNAPQLLEKYKNLARDAQMAGDRVNTEYYLQFADHYFRVLADQRGRSDDQPVRRQRDDFDQFDDDDFGDEGEPIRAEEQSRSSEAESAPRGDRFRDQRPQRDDRQRDDRPRGDRQQRDTRPAFTEQQQQPEQPFAADAEVTAAPVDEEAAPRRRRARKPREDAAPVEQAPAFDADRLPPSLGATAEPVAGEEGEAPKPRRRRVRTASAEAAAAE